MRTIEDHKVNNSLNNLTISVVDEPGQGGANHEYLVHDNINDYVELSFQNGPIGEVGVNGITHEVLLAIVIDRLRSFQKGPYACQANEQALIHTQEALHWLQQRTIERMRRGVEGKNIL